MATPTIQNVFYRYAPWPAYNWARCGAYPLVGPTLVPPQSADPSGGGGGCDFIVGTDVPSTGSIDYGLTTAYGSNKIFAAGDGTSASRFTVTVTGLTPGQTYHWRARVTGKSAPYNVLTVGPDHTFVAQ